MLTSNIFELSTIQEIKRRPQRHHHPSKKEKSSFADACDKVNTEKSSNLCIPDNSLADIDKSLKMPRSWKLDLI